MLDGEILTDGTDGIMDGTTAGEAVGIILMLGVDTTNGIMVGVGIMDLETHIVLTAGEAVGTTDLLITKALEMEF